MMLREPTINVAAHNQLASLQRRLFVWEQLDQLYQAPNPEDVLDHFMYLMTSLTGARRARLVLDGRTLYESQRTEIEYEAAALTLPLFVAGVERGSLYLWKSEAPCGEVMELMQLAIQRWASKWHQLEQTVAEGLREVRVQALLDITGRISSTLDREQLLQQILTYACTLLTADAASIFLLDEATGDLLLHMASGATAEQVRNIRVPKGKGIAGYVAATGETVNITNPALDSRFYGQIDQKTNRQTRALVCVPLRTRAIQLGADLGSTGARIVGVAQMLHLAEDAPFSTDDVRVFEMLCSQAATVLEVAELYANMHELFTDVVEAIANAVDAKDPYTQGHSRRVSEYATEIARELSLSADFIRRVRISGLLHDVGKIGVPDAVLNKPGPLTPAEYEQMQQHPAIGARIMGTVRSLKHELPGLLEHHERVDGTGYPQGLQGDAISVLGRIIAVADAFDAMSSNRAYRPALPIREVVQRIKAGVGSQWDPACVQALLRALEGGRIRPHGPSTTT